MDDCTVAAAPVCELTKTLQKPPVRLVPSTVTQFTVASDGLIVSLLQRDKQAEESTLTPGHTGRYTGLKPDNTRAEQSNQEEEQVLGL